MLDFLRIKKKANIANTHLDELLWSSYNSKLIKKEHQDELSYSTEALFRSLGLKSELGDFVRKKTCFNRCMVFQKPRTVET